MDLANFIHLRVHSGYSLSEGAIKVKDLLDLCKENNMPAVAITDTANLFGGADFSINAAKEGIQPILGAQLWIKKRANSIYENEEEIPSQIVLLSQNQEGYQNLIKLLSKAFLDMDTQALYPFIYTDELVKYSQGLIALSGGVDGIIGKSILLNNIDEAEKDLLFLKDIYQDRLYMEIQRHGLDSEMITEPHFLEMAYKHNIPLVATNEVFFKDRSFYEASDALICIAEKAKISEDNRRKLTEEHYFKSAPEMTELFKDLPEAINNTVQIAKRCGFMVEYHKVMFPVYTADDMGDMNESELMTKRAEEGLKYRLERAPYADEAEYKKRLEYELGVINQMGFPGYFLIVSDFIMYSKKNGIPVGPGRGSGAGSLVAWCLGITDLDPIKFGLLFERFLNPERVSMPDFDIDFCQEKREKTIHYVQEKYGHDKVAQIITYGKLQAKMVIRDVGRVLEVPFPVVDSFAKKIPMRNPDNPNKPITLETAVKVEPELAEMIDEERSINKMYSIARKLEGLYRNASTHAAGIVIGPKPLDEIVPLYKDVRSDIPATQFDMKWIEGIGLIKFDFLGLKTLTVIDKAIALIKKHHGVDIDIYNLPLEDKKTFKLLADAKTSGVFQLESAGMRAALKQIKPDSIEELTALVALYRPGPMENIPVFANRKFKREEIESIHPKLDDLLKETYGIIVYQEQVMEIAKILAGYSLGGADILRRAMGKKIKEEMDGQRKVFIDGCIVNGLTDEKATEIFNLMEKFADYGFNKSHAAAYALIAYQTAYLKALYPVEFMAATMTLDINNTDKLAEFKTEIGKMGIEILPPDINKSFVEFSEEDGKIRYALGAIKNVGGAAMQTLIEEREKNGDFKSMEDFISRFDPHQVNRKSLEGLAKSGCFDKLENNRNKIIASIDIMIEAGNAAVKDKASQQISLFGETNAEVAIKMVDAPEWGQMEKLKIEEEALGFFLSSHPLDGMDKALKKLGVTSLIDIENLVQRNGNGQYKIAGIVSDVKSRIAKSGRKYHIITIADKTEVKEFFCFTKEYEQFKDLLDAEIPLLFDLKAERRIDDDRTRFSFTNIEDLEKRRAGLSPEFEISIINQDAIDDISSILLPIKGGRSEIFIICSILDNDVKISIGKYAVNSEILYKIGQLPSVFDISEG